MNVKHHGGNSMLAGYAVLRRAVTVNNFFSEEAIALDLIAIATTA